MSYKRISVRFNMDVDAERKAWEIIHEKGNGLVGKEVISAINTSSELSGLEKMIRKVVSEELKKAMFIPPEPAARNPETEESETDMDLLTLIAFEGYSQREVAEIRGIAPAAICKKIAKLKKLLYGG